MAQGQTYKKYGGFAAPDFKSMVAGQAAVGDSIKEAFSGVEDLLKKTEDAYRETNTLNMQEYLKGQLKQQGLGADPLDKAAIKQQFGSLINMDQLDAGYQEEKQRMELDASNLIGQEADRVFAETGDELQARKVIQNKASELGARKNFTDRIMQSWTDSNATKRQDLETQKVRDRNVRLMEYDKRVIAGEDPNVAKLALVEGMPEHERLQEIALIDQYEKEKSVLPDEVVDDINYHVNLKEIDGKLRVDQEENAALALAQQLEAVKEQGVQEPYLQLANSIDAEFGQSTSQKIIKELDGWHDKLGALFTGSETDGKYFARRHKEMVDSGIPANEANAILLQAFNTEYDGGGILFNNMNRREMEAAGRRIDSLISNRRNESDLSTRLTAARNRVSEVEADVAKNVLRLRREMVTEARKSVRGIDGALGTEDTYNNFMAELAKRGVTVPTAAFDAQAQAQGQADPGTAAPTPVSPEEEKDAIAQRIIKMDNIDSVDPNANPAANNVTNLNAAVQRSKGQTIQPPKTAVPDAEMGSLQDIQGRIATSGLSDNPVNRAVTGAADSTFDFAKQYSLPGMAINMGERLKDGVSSLRNLSRNRYAGLAEDIRSTNPLSNEEMTAQTQDPVKWTAQNRKVDSKAKSGNLALTDLTGEIRMTPAINESIAKMPSHPEAVKQQANKIKTLKKNEQTRIIEALWLANPELAKGIADLLGIS